MAHVPDGKIKTNMFLIWAGPDGEDIYDNFKLPPNHQYDVDYVLDKFEEFCQPHCAIFMQLGGNLEVYHNMLVRPLIHSTTEY